MIAPVLILLAIAAQPQDRQGVRIESMWQLLGAGNHAACLRNAYSPVPEDEDARETAITAVVKKCRAEAPGLFKGAQFEGGAFPKVFQKEAMAMLPTTEAYLLPILRRLAPSPRQTTDRIKLMIRNRDGETFPLFADRKRVDDGAYLFAELNDE